MMSDIVPFDFETHAVRIVMRDDAPWFVAADVCRVLEHGNPRQVISRLDDDERGVLNVDTLGGEQEMNIVSESGLFALIFTSRKSAAKRFRKWVTAEVLPAIRRDGHYGLPPADHEELVGKRAYYDGLSEAHQQKAARAVEALEVMQEAIDSGANVSQAIDVAADEIGISSRTIWNYRRAVYMVAKADWAAALAPKWSGPRAMCVDCHPDMMRSFLELSSSGAKMSDVYRRLQDMADDNDWGDIPSERTMYRAFARFMPPTKVA